MSDATIAELRAPNKTPVTRFAMAAQCFLLRRNWMGSMGEFVMVMRHRGRRTGKIYETPIAYLRQADDLLAISSAQGSANWFRNVLAAGEAEVIVQGKPMQMKAAQIHDAEEIKRVFDSFHREFKGFERAFRVKPTAPKEQLDVARDRMLYMRLTPA